MADLQKEAVLLSGYLLGEKPTPQHIKLYALAHESKSISLAAKEQRIWRKILKFPFLLPFVDAALALVSPSSAIRHKIFVMLAILEASTDYTRYFLPQNRSALYLFKIAAVGFWAGIKAVLGLLVLLIL